MTEQNKPHIQSRNANSDGSPDHDVDHELDRNPDGDPVGTDPSDRYINRELSWLSFNHRVLQEAGDPTVPLFERIRFLAIYSSNLDEFFRIRVASLRSLLRLRKKSRRTLSLNPVELLRQVHQTILHHQDEVIRIYLEEIVPALRELRIVMVRGNVLSAEQRNFLTTWFEANVLPIVSATFLREGFGGPFLHNRRLYLVVELHPRLDRKYWSHADDGEANEKSESSLAIVEIPSAILPRFISLPSPIGEQHIIALDDVMRLCLGLLFPGFDPIGSWSVKLTRDAELYIDDEFSGDLLKKIRKGLHKRETGVPARFLYDRTMPKSVLKSVRRALDLGEEDLFPGWHYHNFMDLFRFPFPDNPDQCYRPLPPLDHPILEKAESLFNEIAIADQMLHFPYHSYRYVLRFLEEAADDPTVESISITLYRVAANSAVARALIDAVRKGKKVTAFVEVKARFDEESNIYWAAEMERAGVRVLYSFPGLKVHTKLCLITRREGNELKQYAYLSTGNFNEKTATVYTDHALLTADRRLTEEVERVFLFLSGELENPQFEHLLVAPFTLRSRLIALIDREIEQAQAGRTASILLKLNGLEDVEMIEKLYQASEAGVTVRLIVRGICCLKPGVAGLSRNIEAVSIVDRFLEHGRVYLFHNGGQEAWYVASADWMTRNLSRRVEVAFPIYDNAIREELRAILLTQWNDNVKARILDVERTNLYRLGGNRSPVRAQQDIYLQEAKK